MELLLLSVAILFFRCSGKGHIARECPKKARKGNRKAEVCILELEEGIQQLKTGKGPTSGVGKAELSKNRGAQE